MSIKVVMFDLDGTLLPMDTDVFTREYLKAITTKLSSHGYDGEKLGGDIISCMKLMGMCGMEKTNEEVFWDAFREIYGDTVDKDVFDDFYINDFDKVSVVSKLNAKARLAVEKIKAMGYRTVLATSPVFPSIATEKRMKWAGFSPDDFELYTTYENSHFAKPDKRYYTELFEKLGVSAEECLMVGNDVRDDMIARELGCDVFLLTDNLISRGLLDLSVYPSGDFDALVAYVESKSK